MDTKEIKIDRIIRSRRKSVCIQIIDDDRIIIRAPYSMSRSAIEEIFERYRHKIEKKLISIAEKDVEKDFIEGEVFLFLGKEYPLVFVEGKKEPLVFDKGFFLSKRHSEKAKEILENWYKMEFLKILNERVSFYAERYGFKFKRMRISKAKRRWGSCSSKGHLNFSWRLIMAPLDIIDSVIVHELCHLKHPDHSKDFWDLVLSIMPDNLKKRKWLKENGCKFFFL